MKAPQEVDAQYTLSFPERLRANWDLTLASPVSMLSVCVLPLIGIALIWVMSRPTSRNTLWEYFFAVACFTYYPVVFLLNTYRAHRLQSERGLFHYRFDADGVHVTTAKSRLSHLWPAISRVRARRGILFLYFTKRCAHCVPLRALPSSQSLATIQQLASVGGVLRVGT